MKLVKAVENEFFRGGMVILLGLDILLFLYTDTNFATKVLLYGRDGAAFAPHPARWLTAFPARVFMAVLGVVLFALIIRSRGYYSGTRGPVGNFFDRIPLDICIIVIAFLLTFAAGIYGVSYSMSHTSFILASLVIAYCSIIFLCLTVTVRCKNGTLFTCTLVYMGYRGLKNLLSYIPGPKDWYRENLPAFPKWALVITGIFALDFFAFVLLMMDDFDGEDVGTYVIVKFACFAVFLRFMSIYLLRRNRIDKGIEEIAGGDVDYKINTDKMPKSLKRLAENLNNIGNVVSDAAQRRLKSERMKTELITNVSHDIKTPLTSIINYVDLIQKEEIENEKVKEYVEVLGRQSTRLKKLIEDLVEASKASTGNVQVNFESTALGLLLRQRTGEYRDRAKERNLQLNLSVPENEIYIMTDGRLLWRVFDNLLGNACKYSRPGTRIYVDCAENGAAAQVTFRNTSKSMLNISPDELMERFVRGDSSRNTEGSGLGLSIANSLTGLLGGNMELAIDGDLFKVILTFPILREIPDAPAGGL